MCVLNFLGLFLWQILSRQADNYFVNWHNYREDLAVPFVFELGGGEPILGGKGGAAPLGIQVEPEELLTWGDAQFRLL